MWQPPTDFEACRCPTCPWPPTPLTAILIGPFKFLPFSPLCPQQPYSKETNILFRPVIAWLYNSSMLVCPFLPPPPSPQDTLPPQTRSAKHGNTLSLVGTNTLNHFPAVGIAYSVKLHSCCSRQYWGPLRSHFLLPGSWCGHPPSLIPGMVTGCYGHLLCSVCYACAFLLLHQMLLKGRLCPLILTAVPPPHPSLFHLLEFSSEVYGVLDLGPFGCEF